MSDLPHGWEWATLGELAAPEERAITDGPFGSNLKSAHYTDSGARVFRLQNIGDGVFRDERAYISLDHFKRLRAHEAREGDLLVASLGDSPPRACLVPRIDEPAIVKADCIRIRLSSWVDPHWVLYTLLSPTTKQNAAAAIKGVGRPRLGLAQVRGIRVPMPPIAEQRRVVAALEDHLSRLDAGTQTLAAVQRRGRLAIAADLQGILDEARSNFGLAPLNRYTTNSQYGTSTRCSYEDSGRAVLRIPNIQRGEIDLTDLKYASGPVPDALLIREGDLLIVRTNGARILIGRSAVASRNLDCAFASYLIRLRFDTSILLPEWVHVCLQSPQLRKQIEILAASSAGQYNLSAAKLRSLEIPVPPLTDQRELVDKFKALSDSVYRLMSETKRLAARAGRLRSSLLVEAFAGGLVSQDPNDEPASLLLDRIRGERAAQSKFRRARKAASL